MKLIITEKPSVARDIARVLKITTKKDGYICNDNNIVTWALGHLIEFVQPDQYGEKYQKWQLDDLPIIPEHFLTKPIERSKQQYDIVKELLQSKDIKEVVCATDAGREGELIFRLLYDDAKCKAPIKRLWVSSQTDTAIKKGFNELKPGKDYEPLYDSARSRAEADWIVGINATRAYSIKFSRGRGVMSVGRVQTPVLYLIVNRYRDHIQFKSTTFYDIFLDVKHPKGNLQLKWFKKNIDRLTDKNEADTIVTQLKKEPTATIDSLTQKKIIEKQPLLYDLTELQKDANKQFKFSADQTLTIMQDLYEKHKLLSYPRTSSRYLSSDIAPTLPNLLTKISQIKDLSNSVKHIQDKKYTIAPRMIDDKKVTDHHAIIPTDKTPNIGELPTTHKQVYLMVIRRFVAAFYPECEKSHTEIIATCSNHTFKTTGTIVITPGWRTLYPNSDDKKNQELPNVKKGDVVDVKKVSLKKGQTKAPALFTEASILGAMETAGKTIDDDDVRQAMKDCGLGTPATRAQILEKLIHVNYITREKNKLLPTPKGEYLIDCMLSQSLTSPELTGQWEQQLNNMAKAKENREDYMEKIIEFTKEIINDVTKDESYVIGADQKIFGDCPSCKTGKIIETPKAFGCSKWKSDNCKFAIWKMIAQKTITEAMVKTLLKNGKTNVIKGFKNKEGKPFDAALTINKDQINFDFQKKSLGSCPLCNEGTISETPKAYSCDQWRTSGCKFTIWKTIASRNITEKEALELIEKKELNNLTGFKSRAGSEFTASLEVTSTGQTQFKPR